jgi:hypothetical protein
VCEMRRGREGIRGDMGGNGDERLRALRDAGEPTVSVTSAASEEEASA